MLILALASCRQGAGPQPRSIASTAPPSPAIPKTWSDIGLPQTGLVKVWSETNEHGFYADYSGHDRAALLDAVSKALAKAGYYQSCTAVDGLVIGFSDGRRELALKIDTLPELSLSIFDAAGKEPLLHGLCFGRYREGATHTLSQAEKEALAKSVEPSPVPQASSSPIAPR